jgi:alpha-mannosidase
VDLGALADLIASARERPICHGSPEDYFADLSASGVAMPAHRGDLNPWAVGCYTSMATVKRQHRQLEQALYATEMMLANAALQRRLRYPAEDLRKALEALLFCEFHDILPGSSVSDVEDQALQRLGAGLDLVARLRARAFFAFLDGQSPASDGEFPIFVHNHHPFAVEDTVVCEFQPPEPNFDRTILYRPEIIDASGAIVLAQTEKESCNIQIDQRKRVVFRVRLAPSSTARFSCRLNPGARGVEPRARPLSGPFIHRTRFSETEIDSETGLLTRYQVDGVDYLGPRVCRLLVVKDTADPWGMKVRAFRDVVGEFTLMSEGAAADFAGVSGDLLAPVRVIEEGPVRTVVEALFAYRRSALCLRYHLPSEGSEIEVDLRVTWMEKDRMLKLSLPTPFIDGALNAQVAYGVERPSRRAEELLAHKWVAVTSADGSRAFTVINDATYGYDFEAGELRLSLLRSPAYAGHPVDDVTPIVRQDRFEPRIDQGEHRFRFWLNAGAGLERLDAIWREATVRNDGLMALCAFPRGGGTLPTAGVLFEDDVAQLEAMKIAENGRRLILRLFEPTGRARATTVAIPPLGLRFNVDLGAFELRTLAVDLDTGAVTRTDLLERDIVST